MVALFLLHAHGDMICPVRRRTELRRQRDVARVVDALDLLREAADVHGLFRELREHGAHIVLARLDAARDRDIGHTHVHVLNIRQGRILVRARARRLLHTVNRTRGAAAVRIHRCGGRSARREQDAPRQECCPYRCLLFSHTHLPFSRHAP